MNVLVLNSGSSSQKSCLYEIGDTLPQDPPSCIWEGKIEWADDKAEYSIKNSRGACRKDLASVGSRAQVIEHLLQSLWSGETRAISGPSDIDVVGHRVVHGGPHHFEPTVVTAKVKSAMQGVLEARGEFEYVGAKPLGTGCDPNNPSAECTGVPVKKFRAAVVRPFLSGRMDAGVNMLIASGYTGQTTENFPPPTVDRHTGSGGGSHTLVCQRHPYLSVWTLAGLDASPARRLRAAKSRYRSGK